MDIVYLNLFFHLIRCAVLRVNLLLPWGPFGHARSARVCPLRRDGAHRRLPDADHVFRGVDISGHDASREQQI